MKTNFSIKNISLLIKRYFVENAYREILFWSIIILIFTVFDQRDFVQFVIISSGLIFSNNLYKDQWNETSGIHFFMIPATQAEKITTVIFLNTVYFFAMSILAYIIGHALIILVYHLVLKIEIPISWDLFQVTKTIFVNGRTYVSIENEFWKILANFAFIQSLSMLGSLYFKINNTIKTIISLIGIAVLLGITQIILMRLFLGEISMTDGIIYLNIALKSPNTPTFIDYSVSILGYLLIPYLWLICYFKLREKQI